MFSICSFQQPRSEGGGLDGADLEVPFACSGGAGAERMGRVGPEREARRPSVWNSAYTHFLLEPAGIFRTRLSRTEHRLNNLL